MPVGFPKSQMFVLKFTFFWKEKSVSVCHLSKIKYSCFQISSKKFHKIQSILARYIYPDMININIYHY